MKNDEISRDIKFKQWFIDQGFYYSHNNGMIEVFMNIYDLDETCYVIEDLNELFKQITI